jgi:5-formyltetrahydrofolate cyclo-ligase
MDKPGLKSAFRAKARAVLKTLPAETRQRDSEKLCARLTQQAFFQNAGSLLFFASLPEEPDLWPLLQNALAGKKLVALPCFDGDNQAYRPRRVTNLHVEILSGQFGIREPSAACVEIPLKDLEVAFVPGVAFDPSGHRLGRGKGFYDRMLENFTGKKVGIAFDEQMVDAIPAEKNDVRMDLIMTPTRCVNCSQSV